MARSRPSDASQPPAGEAAVTNGAALIAWAVHHHARVQAARRSPIWAQTPAAHPVAP